VEIDRCPNASETTSVGSTKPKQSFAFEDGPHEISLARRPGTAVNLYNNGKIVIAGNNIALIDPLREFLVSLDAEEAAKQEDTRTTRN
jgi:ribonuclease HIII